MIDLHDAWTKRFTTFSATLTAALFTTLSLGSCASFHTPLSRPLFETTSTSRDPAAVPSIMSNGNESFDWPVDSARMTRGFLPHKKRPHLGLDLAAPRGTPILGARSGTVIYTGREFRGFGKMILVESGDGWATLYAHLDKILVSEGQRIRQGEVLGAMGRTGRATGVHLHFEIRKDRGPVDPLPLLPMAGKVAQHKIQIER